METVVDVIKKPDARLYSYWAYAGCGYEWLWGSFDAFLVEHRAEWKEWYNFEAKRVYTDRY